MSVEQLTNGNPDGSLMGRSDDKLAFLGGTPVVQQTGWAVPTDLTTVIAGNTACRLAFINYGLITTV